MPHIVPLTTFIKKPFGLSQKLTNVLRANFFPTASVGIPNHAPTPLKISIIPIAIINPPINLFRFKAMGTSFLASTLVLQRHFPLFYTTGTFQYFSLKGLLNLLQLLIPSIF